VSVRHIFIVILEGALAHVLFGIEKGPAGEPGNASIRSIGEKAFNTKDVENHEACTKRDPRR
jgi:hypothetical protein